MKMNLLVAIMMCGGAPAVKADQAPSPVPTIDPGKINRHFGFFIRPELGVGYATGSETFPQGDLQVTGLAGSAGVNLGGAVVEDTILGVHFYDVVLSNPTVSVGNQTASTTDTSYSLFAIGPSVTHYFMPVNLYLSGTIALTQLSVTVNGKSANANTGFGGRVTLGKEWWVSDHWGLGLSASATYSSNQDTGTNAPTISSLFYGLAFSATYN